MNPMRPVPRTVSQVEQQRFRLAVLCTFAYLSLFVGFIGVMVASDMGLIDLAALFGLSQHEVWVFMSEGLGTVVFLACTVGFAVSCALGLPSAAGRASRRLWILGPPAVVFGLTGAATVVLVVSLILNPR